MSKTLRDKPRDRAISPADSRVPSLCADAVFEKERGTCGQVRTGLNYNFIEFINQNICR